jgi:hypothetical protein
MSLKTVLHRHSGFHVFCKKRISPQDETVMKTWKNKIYYPGVIFTGADELSG